MRRLAGSTLAGLVVVMTLIGGLEWASASTAVRDASVPLAVRSAAGSGDSIGLRPLRGPGGTEIKVTGYVGYSCGGYLFIKFLDSAGSTSELGRVPVGAIHFIGNIPIGAPLGIGQVEAERLVPNPPFRCYGEVVATTPFKVTDEAGIFGFDPWRGPAGTVVEITGIGFKGASLVKFNGTASQFTVKSDGRIRAIVPAGATSGPIVIVSPEGRAVSGPAFKVS